MNLALLTRLFRSIEGNKNSPLIKITYSIIEDEKRKGHGKLTDKLNTILKDNLVKHSSELVFKVAKDRVNRMPFDRN